MNTVFLAILLSPLAPALHAQAIPATTTYYFGKTTRSLPDGSPAGSMDCLVKRKLYPTQNLIIELNACVDPQTKNKPREFVTIASISGSRFEMVELNDSFSGKGEFHGASWNWDSWESHSTMPDGSTLESRDKITTVGLIADKKYFDRTGKLVITMQEVLASISDSEYQERRHKLFPDQ